MPDDDLSILPLINVIFLLLIFFMVTGHMTAADPFDIRPPLSASEDSSDPDMRILHMSADGQLALDGEPMSREQLMVRLQTEARGVSLQLKVDGQTPARDVVEVLSTIEALGISSLTLSTILRKNPADGPS